MLWIGCLLLGSVCAAPAAETFPATSVALDGAALQPSHGTTAGFWLVAADDQAQLAVMGHPPRRAVADLAAGHRLALTTPLGPLDQPAVATLRLAARDGRGAVVTLRAGQSQTSATIADARPLVLRLPIQRAAAPQTLTLDVAAGQQATAVRLERLQLAFGESTTDIAWRLKERDYPQAEPVASSPALRPAIEQTLVEWDWRMQDGLETPRERRTPDQAVTATLARGALLLADLETAGNLPPGHRASYATLTARHVALQKTAAADADAWEALWRDVHAWRRALALANPLADVGPLVFAKHVPSTMSHQLTQYYGYEARPGGGLFVLEAPGRSMRVQELSRSLPAGNYLHPEVSFDGRRLYFAFCPCAQAPAARRHPEAMLRRYHLYAINRDGSDLRQLTTGDYDDFAPKCLPNGKLVFISTRRGGFHRCGAGPCYVYTLALAESDGSNPRPISFHETNEWDPAVLHDGRVIYTRWDYVDRNAVFYQQLWTARQDGSQVAIYYGNNTYNPVGTWEARPVPGSHKIMATAAPHHGMTAGSIILLDVTRAIDGPAAIQRLTPDALFPEAESPLAHGVTVDKPIRYDDELPKAWGPQGQSQATRLKDNPTEERRWPGHCYRSPYPLSEKYFLAAYSFDRLRGEPGANRPNMFGLYLCDAWGNKELLYRDPNIASQWPVPLRPRPMPPVLEMPSHWAESTPQRPEGTLLLSNVYQSWPKLPDVEIQRLRIVQVLPKTTPHANNPRVGAANASPGKQVLGTVPVQRDGSAYFRVPAGIPLTFQALDARGRAVQTMRSLVYLQPGEQLSCIGCHEPRTDAAPPRREVLALAGPPTEISPGPDGSRPLSYPLLVQPVLDRHCVRCHSQQKPEGQVVLSGEPAGVFSRSYQALVPHVAYTAWGLPQNNFEPLTTPDRFGARASKLVTLLDRGHYDVQLSAEEWERLVTWIDANALFYGTFDPADQARQLRGQRIAGPALE